MFNLRVSFLHAPLPTLCTSHERITTSMSFNPRRSFPCHSPIISRSHYSPYLVRRGASLSSRNHSDDEPSSYTKSNDFFEIELQVRHYEVDQHGLVNDIVYQGYCEQAYFRLLKEFDMDQEGYKQALKERHLKFISPLKNGDKFVAMTRILYCTKTRLYVQQLIHKLPNKELVLESNATVVWLDNKYRLVRVPNDLKHRFLQMGLYKH